MSDFNSSLRTDSSISNSISEKSSQSGKDLPYNEAEYSMSDEISISPTGKGTKD